jgi:hypothetical protein
MHLDRGQMRYVAACFIATALSPAPPAPGPCDRPAIETATWRRDGGSTFDLALPPGFQRKTAETLDSEGGAWQSSRAQISFDFGAYSNALDDSLTTSGAICRVKIGGRSARFVIYRDISGQYAVGAHWRDFPSSSLGPVSLTLSARAVDALSRDSLVAAIWSVAFKP